MTTPRRAIHASTHTQTDNTAQTQQEHNPSGVPGGRKKVTELIQALCVRQELDSALYLFQQQPHPFDASMLVSELSKQREDFAACMDVYSTLIASGVQPDTKLMRAMLTAANRCHKSNVVPLLLPDIQRYNVELDEASVHMMSRACGESGDAASAKEFVRWLQARPLEGARANMLDFEQLCKVLLSRGDRAEAFNLLDWMTGHRGLQPSVLLCCTILDECSGASALSAGKKLHNVILSCGHAIKGVLATTLIQMYSRCGSLADAMSVWNNTRSRSGGNWCAIISAHIAHGQEAKALQLFEQMAAAGAPADQTTYATILPVYEKLGVPKVRELHAQISKNTTTGQLLLPSMINVYSTCGSLDDAFKLFNEFRSKGKAGVNAWTAIISAHAQHNQNRQAIDLFEEMLAAGMQPDKVTFAAVVNAAQQLGDLDRVRRIAQLDTNEDAQQT